MINKFLSEILGQPESLEATLNYYLGPEGERKLKEIGKLFRKEEFRQIIFTGMGSSYFTSYAAACFFNNNGFHSWAINTSELLYYHFSLITEKTLVVCISQSGESIEVAKLLEKLPSNIFCLGISNEENSTLTAKSEEFLLSKAGPEEMTSTKTYTSMTLVVFILGWFLADTWGKEKMSKIKGMIKDTELLLARHENLVTDELKFLGEIEFLQFIGRGPSFSTALQSELMIKEAAKIPSTATLGGEFRHGPMEMVKAGFKSVLFASVGNTYQQSIKMARDIAKNKGKVVLITNKNPHLSDPNIKAFIINQPDEYLFVIYGIIPVQLMVNYIALAEGLVPGNFVNGGKVTLLE
ncbi:MAG: SIS domain-containing protein [Bacteroidota bacterium]